MWGPGEVEDIVSHIMDKNSGDAFAGGPRGKGVVPIVLSAGVIISIAGCPSWDQIA